MEIQKLLKIAYHAKRIYLSVEFKKGNCYNQGKAMKSNEK